MHLATESSSLEAETFCALPSEPTVIVTLTLTLGFVVGLRSQHVRRMATAWRLMTWLTWPLERHCPGAAGSPPPGSSPGAMLAPCERPWRSSDRPVDVGAPGSAGAPPVDVGGAGAAAPPPFPARGAVVFMPRDTLAAGSDAAVAVGAA